MPARIDHPAVREQVRLLYLANGKNLSAAAKQAGIPLARAEKWKQRDPTNWEVATVSDSVRKVTDNLATALEQDNRETKLSLSKGLRKAAKEMEEMPGKTIYASADKAKHLVGAASQIHGWAETKEAGLNLNILSIGGEMAVQINKGSG